MSGLAEQIQAAAALEGVPSALVSARDGVDALLRDRGPRRTTPELVAESLLRGAAASARLEGSPSSLAQLRAGEADDCATSAVRLNAELLALVPVVSRSPLQALARMHALVAVGHGARERLGRPRPADGVATRLHALAACLLSAPHLPAIAVAAFAHAEIATLAPFDCRNGMVARALERLVLVARGVDPTSMLVPEAGHLVLSSSYQAALSAYHHDGSSGRREWLLHCAAAVVQAAEQSPLR